MHSRRLRLKCDDTRTENQISSFSETDESIEMGGGVSSVDYWQSSCSHQPAGFVLLVQACVLQPCDAYCLPTTFSCFPFTSPPVRYRVPSHFNWTLQHRRCTYDVTVRRVRTTIFVVELQ